MKLEVTDIDNLLPQTQCGLCGYGGCRPYAEAIANETAPINLCPPGGTATLQKLAVLTEQNATPYLPEMRAKEKPAMRAVINEEVCIGCTKCIQACPVDAIVGTGKLMHTVIADECSGCELCIEPCPVDCIDMVLISKPDENTQAQRAYQYRQRFDFRNKRLEKLSAQNRQKHQQAKLSIPNSKRETTIAARKAFIKDALMRVKAKYLKDSNI